MPEVLVLTTAIGTIHLMIAHTIYLYQESINYPINGHLVQTWSIKRVARLPILPVNLNTKDLSIVIYDERNANRLPAYHRLDIAATYKPNRKPDKRWKGEWIFSIYNLYNRMNAASITFNQNYNTGVNEALRTSIFGIIPSITYNFKF